MGAPKGNRNALRHGLRSVKLPSEWGYLYERLCVFRRTVENAVIVARGEVALTDATTIQSAVRHERRALLCERWLAQNGDTLTADQLLRFLESAAKASDARDKCLQRLGLDLPARGDALDIRALYASPPADDASDDPEG